MKQFKILNYFLFFLLLMSCSKNDELSFENIEKKEQLFNKPVTEQINYVQSNLREIGAEIATLAKEKDFRSFVKNETKKKFDEEYEVLIQDIFKNNIWKSRSNFRKIETNLNNLKNLNGVNLFPQIYIPKLQHLEDLGISQNQQNSLGDNAGDDGEFIVYVYYAGDSEVDSATNESESYPGYYLNAQGQMQYWGMVNEEYANNNEVWIISLNESVNSQGYVCPLVNNNGVNFAPDCDGGGGGGGNTPPPPGGCNGNPDCDSAASLAPHPDMGQHLPVNFKIEQMIVKQNHESWLAGASEIAIRANLNCHNNLDLGKNASTGAVSTQYLSDNSSRFFTGQFIKKFKRKDIKNGTIKFLNYSLQKNWPTQFYASDPVWFDYIIFERDIFPAKINRAPWGQHPGRVDLLNLPYTGEFSVAWNMWYRSGGKNKGNNYYYSKGSFVNNILISSGQSQFYQTGYVNNSEIEFNTKAY